MKYLYIYISTVSLSLLFASCTNENQEVNINSSVVSDFESNPSESIEGFVKFDLRPFELNASLLVPKEERSSIKHHLDTYEWELKMGKQTYVTIQDWGTLDGFQKYLEKLEKTSETVEFIKQEENFVLYTLTTGTSKVSYHTAAQHTIEGVNYLFESSSNGLSKDGVEHAVISVKSVVSND